MDTIVKMLSEHMKKHMPHTHVRLQKYNPTTLRIKLALKVMPEVGLQNMQESHAQEVRSSNLKVLASVWHELQKSRTQIRQRDNAPMIGYTTYSIDTTRHQTSQQDAVLDSLIEKVEEAIKAFGGSFIRTGQSHEE